MRTAHTARRVLRIVAYIAAAVLLDLLEMVALLVAVAVATVLLALVLPLEIAVVIALIGVCVPFSIRQALRIERGRRAENCRAIPQQETGGAR